MVLGDGGGAGGGPWRRWAWQCLLVRFPPGVIELARLCGAEALMSFGSFAWARAVWGGALSMRPLQLMHRGFYIHAGKLAALAPLWRFYRVESTAFLLS